MRILVAVKCVPDTTARISVAASGRSMDPAGVKFVMSPYDEMALEQALRLREDQGSGEVVALTVGGEKASTLLRSALAMGADSALHLKVEAPTGLELDGFQTATALAEALREESFDLLFFGRLAADSQGSQVGTYTARLLGIPSVAEVTQVELRDNKVRFHHSRDGRIEVVECSLPAAATAQKGLAEPRFPSMKAIMTAKKKPLVTRDVGLPDSVLEIVKLELPPPRQPGRIVGEGAGAVEELVRLLREEAKVI